MKLWEKGIATDKQIEHFTVGNDRELDLVLAKRCVGFYSAR
jgi:argininosuccinate lyase